MHVSFVRADRQEGARIVQRLFSLDLPFFRFAWNTFLVSCAGLVPLLALYIALTPEFTQHLASGGPTLSRFMRQVLTNGLPVVFIVNYVGFILYATALSGKLFTRGPVLVLALDVTIRIACFCLLHVLIYLLSADWFGSFGGSRGTALRVVAPTLARSAFFENISGVYLYATLVSAIPLYVAVFQDCLARCGSQARFPTTGVAIFLSVILFGAGVVSATRVGAWS